MNEGKELIKALDDIEKEKGISKDILLEAIENSLVAACKNEYGKADNIRVTMNRETGEVKVFADETVVEEVEDPEMEISVADARLKNKFYDPGDIVHVAGAPPARSSLTTRSTCAARWPSTTRTTPMWSLGM